MTLQRYQDYNTGEGLTDWSASRMRAAADEVRQAGNVNTGNGLQISKTPSGTSIRLDKPRRVPRGMVSRLVYVKEVRDDTLICGTVGGGGDLEVAKPLDLQLQSYFLKSRRFLNEEGHVLRATYTWSVAERKEIQRQVIIQNLTEPQQLSTFVQEMITPPYAVADDPARDDEDASRFLAVLVGDSKAGVTGVPFIDWNNAGRAWAEAKIEGGQP